jgi:hypothetical protein
MPCTSFFLKKKGVRKDLVVPFIPWSWSTIYKKKNLDNKGKYNLTLNFCTGDPKQMEKEIKFRSSSRSFFADF